MNKHILLKRAFAAAALLTCVSMQSMADSFNNVWVKAFALPSNGGGVYVDYGLDDINLQSVSEFKRSSNATPSSAFIYTEPATGFLFAGVARDMDRNGAYDAEKDRQIHIWYNYFFTAFYDHTDYIGGSSTEAMEIAEEALAQMTQPTDQVLAIFTKGDVAKRAIDEEACGYVFSSKLDNQPGDQVTFYAYGDVDSRNSPNKYYKFHSWLDEQGNTVSTNRELTVTVQGMKTYYAHFEQTSKAEYQTTEKLPDRYKWDYNNPEWDPAGIETVSAGKSAAASSAIYDLQGRRVAQPGKGLFIQNGKKFVNK